MYPLSVINGEMTMIKLAIYVINDSFHIKPSVLREKLQEYANRAYNDGVKQAGYDGYILLTNTNDKHLDYFTAYLYKNDTNRSFNVKAKITDKGLLFV